MKFRFCLFCILILTSKITFASDPVPCEKQGRIGISVQDLSADLAISFEYPSLKGALIGQVSPDSPASMAGPEQGDIIFEYAGTQIESSNHFVQLTADTAPGTLVKIGVFRHKSKIIKELTLINKCVIKKQP